MTRALATDDVAAARLIHSLRGLLDSHRVNMRPEEIVFAAATVVQIVRALDGALTGNIRGLDGDNDQGLLFVSGKKARFLLSDGMSSVILDPKEGSVSVETQNVSVLLIWEEAETGADLMALLGL